MTQRRSNPEAPTVASVAWLAVKVAFFILATFEGLDIIVVAYQRF